MSKSSNSTQICIRHVPTLSDSPLSLVGAVDDQRKVWNKNRASLLHAPQCPNDSETLTLIKTSPKNFKLRQLARRIAEVQNSGTILFLIGRHEGDSRLEGEIEKYDDFIIGDFIDSYNNLTLKTLTGYREVPIKVQI